MPESKRKSLDRRPGATDRARSLRRSQTDHERILWNHLRDRRLEGHKFLRQVPLGPYVADFLCRERFLVVELDGSQHCDSAHDIVRTQWLNGQGYAVLRIWNHELVQTPLAVLDTILAALDGRLDGPCAITRFHPPVTN